VQKTHPIIQPAAHYVDRLKPSQLKSAPIFHPLGRIGTALAELLINA
jgi:hypothetical protein